MAKVFHTLLDEVEREVRDFLNTPISLRYPPGRPVPGIYKTRCIHRPGRKAVIEYYPFHLISRKQYDKPPVRRVTILKQTSFPSGMARRWALIHDTLPTHYTFKNGVLVPEQ